MLREGEKPRASNVGNVISVPEPTTTLINPAAMPAPAMASAERATTSVYIAGGGEPQFDAHPGDRYFVEGPQYGLPSSGSARGVSVITTLERDPPCHDAALVHAAAALGQQR